MGDRRVLDVLEQFLSSFAFSQAYSISYAVQVNDLRSRGKQLSGTEHIFITATMQFRENIKGMYSFSVSRSNSTLLKITQTLEYRPNMLCTVQL